MSTRFIAALGYPAVWVSFSLMPLPAFAHGITSGNAIGAEALIIFPVAAILFILFLVFMHHKKGWTVLVTGGAGYIGSALVPKLLQSGHKVVVLDLFPHGDKIFEDYRGYLDLRQIKGDFRDEDTLQQALNGCDAVIHLACVTDATTQILDAVETKSINFEAFRPLVRAAKNAGVKRFIYASSFRVYSASENHKVTEDMPLGPTSDYSKHKALCENELGEERASGFVVCSIRSAVVCGYAAGLRPDDMVNNFTKEALTTGCLRVPDNCQKQPFIHIDDIADLFKLLLRRPAAQIDGKVYNAGSENLSSMELAEIVKAEVGDGILVKKIPEDSHGSYEMCSDKIRLEQRFEPKYRIEDAIGGLVAAIRNGGLPDTTKEADK